MGLDQLVGRRGIGLHSVNRRRRRHGLLRGPSRFCTRRLARVDRQTSGVCGSAMRRILGGLCGPTRRFDKSVHRDVALHDLGGLRVDGREDRRWLRRRRHLHAGRGPRKQTPYARRRRARLDRCRAGPSSFILGGLALATGAGSRRHRAAVALHLWIRRAHGSTMCLAVLLVVRRSHRHTETATRITTTDVRCPSGCWSVDERAAQRHGLVPAELRELWDIISLPLRAR
mmetsp:Transcript_2220/g.5215  ORF Transcript_2220/g.5215 Transcript_2220/m.5215 type:complete len:229 (+) Transcript_2220:278-964(+)